MTRLWDGQIRVGVPAGRWLSCFSKHPGSLWTYSVFYSTGTGWDGSFRRGKQAGREADHAAASSAKIKNEWSYDCTPSPHHLAGLLIASWKAFWYFAPPFAAVTGLAYTHTHTHTFCHQTARHGRYELEYFGYSRAKHSVIGVCIRRFAIYTDWNTAIYCSHFLLCT